MASHRILIVDDSVGLSQHWIIPLLLNGYRVDQALSGEEALQKLAAQRYDLVILDLIMPRVSGADVLLAIRKGKTRNENAGTPENVKVVIWSVYNKYEASENAPGADAYFAKQKLSPESLLAEVQRLLGQET